MKRVEGRTRRTRTALTPFEVTALVEEFRKDLCTVGHAPTQFVMARRFAKDLAEQNYTHSLQDLAREEEKDRRRERWAARV